MANLAATILMHMNRLADENKDGLRGLRSTTEIAQWAGVANRTAIKHLHVLCDEELVEWYEDGGTYYWRATTAAE